MMKKITRIAALLAATAFLLAGFPACSDDDDDGDPTLTAVEIAVADTVQKVYTVGEELNWEGVTVTAKYSDGGTEDVTDKATITATSGDAEFTTKTEGGSFEVTLTATYEGKKSNPVTHTITVKAKETVVEPGQDIDGSGGSGSGTGEGDGGSGSGTGQGDGGSGSDGEAGDEDLTVTKIKIDIDEAALKTEYTVNEKFATTGITVTATLSDGKTKDVTAEAEFMATTGDGEEFTTKTAGTYTVTLTATYKGKTAKTDPCTITVKANGSGTETPDPNAGGSTVSCLVPDEAITDDEGNGKEIEAGEAIVDSALFTITSDGKVAYSIGKDASAGVPNSSKPISVTLLDGTAKTFKQGIKQSEATDPDGTTPTKKVLVKAKEAITLRAYIALANDSFNSDRAGKIYYAIGTGEAESITVAKRTDVQSIEVNLAKDETLEVYAIIDKNDTKDDKGNLKNTAKLWLFGAEAKKQ